VTDFLVTINDFSSSGPPNNNEAQRG